ncbi:MAG TPA: flagellar hook-length control protein FliK [Nevskiaceae bacterium]|nr:flagellar hook-length control protein FliK [Nevskiaceae bacterium]
MGAVTPGIDTLLSEVLGVGPFPAIRGAPGRVPDVGSVRAGRATSGDSGSNARPFARTLDAKEAGRTAAGSAAGARSRSEVEADPASSPSGSVANLSDAARAIAEALAQTGDAETLQVQAPTAPLVPHPDAALLSALVDALAVGLQESVAHSGLFYESHLARWAAGVYTAADLSQEPQMLPARLASALSAVRAARAAMPDDVAPSVPPGGSQPTVPAGTAFSPQTAAIVHQQLQMLAQPTITLQVTPWPGAQATMRMTPAWPWHPGDGMKRHHQNPQPKPWTVDLHLRTRNLGAITAHLSVAAGRVGLRLDADHWTAARLHVGVPQLRRRLESAGVETFDIAVTEDAKR